MISETDRKKLVAALPPDAGIDEISFCEAGELALFPGITLKDVPQHIRVLVSARPETGSNIKIELWLPAEGWNGDLVGVGNGGYAGMLPSFSLAMPLRLGFAAVTTDMGTSAGPDCGIGNRAVWTDFGHRATHLMATIGKGLTAAYYGTPVRYAYFIGNSTGGQQALSEAQRYPEDFDGILASSPAYDRVNLHMAFVHDWQALTAPGVEPFTPELQAAVAQAFLRKKAGEGERREEDLFFLRPDKIIVKRNDLEGIGLSERQIDALLNVYRGLPGIYEPSLTPGSENDGLGICRRADRDAFAFEFFYLFRWVLGKDFDFTAFDFEKDGATVREALSSYVDATNPDLTAFRDHGGKLLLIHGTADPIIPMASSMRYFRAVQERMGDTADFFRLFLMPGMAHGFGGPGVQDYVMGLPALPKDEKHLGLLTLKAWVEEGKAPDVITPVAYHPSENPLDILRPGGIAWEREVRPYKE